MDKLTNRIQTLLGVGEKLWVGLENGWISVLDASNKMELIKHWRCGPLSLLFLQTENGFNRAHKSSIALLMASSTLGSLVVASMSEVGNLHFWDGGLSWDWIGLSFPPLCCF